MKLLVNFIGKIVTLETENNFEVGQNIWAIIEK